MAASVGSFPVYLRVAGIEAQIGTIELTPGEPIRIHELLREAADEFGRQAANPPEEDS